MEFNNFVCSSLLSYKMSELNEVDGPSKHLRHFCGICLRYGISSVDDIADMYAKTQNESPCHFSMSDSVLKSEIGLILELLSKKNNDTSCITLLKSSLANSGRLDFFEKNICARCVYSDRYANARLDIENKLLAYIYTNADAGFSRDFLGSSSDNTLSNCFRSVIVTSEVPYVGRILNKLLFQFFNNIEPSVFEVLVLGIMSVSDFYYIHLKPWLIERTSQSKSKGRGKQESVPGILDCEDARIIEHIEYLRMLIVADEDIKHLVAELKEPYTYNPLKLNDSCSIERKPSYMNSSILMRNDTDISKLISPEIVDEVEPEHVESAEAVSVNVSFQNDCFEAVDSFIATYRGELPAEDVADNVIEDTTTNDDEEVESIDEYVETAVNCTDIPEDVVTSEDVPSETEVAEVVADELINEPEVDDGAFSLSDCVSDVSTSQNGITLNIFNASISPEENATSLEDSFSLSDLLSLNSDVADTSITKISYNEPTSKKEPAITPRIPSKIRRSFENTPIAFSDFLNIDISRMTERVVSVVDINDVARMLSAFGGNRCVAMEYFVVDGNDGVLLYSYNTKQIFFICENRLSCLWEILTSGRPVLTVNSVPLYYFLSKHDCSITNVVSLTSMYTTLYGPLNVVDELFTGMYFTSEHRLLSYMCCYEKVYYNLTDKLSSENKVSDYKELDYYMRGISFSYKLDGCDKCLVTDGLNVLSYPGSEQIEMPEHFVCEAVVPVDYFTSKYQLPNLFKDVVIAFYKSNIFSRYKVRLLYCGDNTFTVLGPTEHENYIFDIVVTTIRHFYSKHYDNPLDFSVQIR